MQICHDGTMRSAGELRHGHAGRLLRRTHGALILIGAVVLAACGGDTDSQGATTTSTPSTPTSAPATTAPAPTTAPTPAPTIAPDDPTVDLSTGGPFPVGVTTWALPGGTPVEVWYPAVAGTIGTTSYDLRDYTPDFLAPLLANASDTMFEFAASRDAEASAQGPFPLVVFSHGFTGMRVQSTFLTAHLASYGMVVAAPDHASRDLRNVLGGVASGDQAEAVAELVAVIDLASAPPDAVSGLATALDITRVALLGHSAGGASVQGAANDPRVAGVIAMAAGGPPEGFDIPGVPSLFMAGTTDRVVSASERTRPAHLASASPSWYLEIAQTGHNGFDDFCLLGGGTGIIGVAENAGLGAILQAQPTLRTLGEDGCLPPAADVSLAHPLIQHAVTAWLMWLWDTPENFLADETIDPMDIEVRGLGSADLDQFALGSILTVR